MGLQITSLKMDCQFIFDYNSDHSCRKRALRMVSDTPIFKDHVTTSPLIKLLIKVPMK